MNREVRVGLLFTLAIGLLAGALYFLGNFQENVTYKIRFLKVSGLARDSPVHFNGVPIGRVVRIELSEDVSSQSVPIIVTIAVDKSARRHIRRSTRADIKSVGVLGDKLIVLETEDYTEDALVEDDFIQPAPKSLDVEKLLAQGTDFVSDLTEIANELKAVLKRFSEGEGIAPRLVQDKQMADDFQRALSRAVAYMENEQSLAALVFRDEAFAARVRTGLEQTLANAAAASETLAADEGLLPMLMTDQVFKDEVKDKILDTLDASSAYIEALQEGRGLLYKLSQDEAYSERVAANIEKASFHLASVLEKIDTGDGSAALMINDPSIYQGVYEVIYGLKNSGLSSWYIRSKQRKGARMIRKRDAQAQSEDRDKDEP